jgi:hypothetical protein
MRKLLAVVGLFFAISVLTFGQEVKTSELFKTIKFKDSMLFNIGFNTCNIKQFENLLSDKFEFFHDKDRISYKTEFIHNLKNGLCISPKTYQSRRELVDGSTEIYPMYKDKILYGVIQIDIHKFYETIDGKKETFASKAKFTHVWLLNGEWKLTKSLSYDHQVNAVFDNNLDFEVSLQLTF